MLDHALGEVGGLRPPGAAIGPGLRRVGEQALAHDVHRLHVVGFRNEAQREQAAHHAGADEVGADLEQRLRADREDLAVLVERQLAVADEIAAGVVGHHAFGARRDPLHRAPQLARRPQHQHVVRERAALQAEAAADVGRDHAHLVLVHMKDMRDLHAHAVRILRRGVERVVVVRRVVVADRGARLHRHRRDPVVLHAQLHDVLRLGEGRVGRAPGRRTPARRRRCRSDCRPTPSARRPWRHLRPAPRRAASRNRPRSSRRRRAPARRSRPRRTPRGRRRSAPSRPAGAADGCGGPSARRYPPASWRP